MITVPLASNPTSNATASPFQHPGSRQRIDRQVLSETVSGLRISAVDGTAFIDNAETILPYCDGNHQITITDSTGKEIVGVLGAVGTGEALGSELFPDLDFTSGWTPLTTTINSANQYTVISNGIRGVAKPSVFNLMGLYKGSLLGTSTNSTPTLTTFSISPLIVGTGFCAMGSTGYVTPNLPDIYIRGVNHIANDIVVVSSISLKQVTSPSTTGALIKASPTGAQSFTSKDTDFAYNAASYDVTVKRIYL